MGRNRMNEFYIKMIFILLALTSVVFLAVSIVFENKYEKSQEEIERLEFKNEILQDENNSLRDQVWNLNQYLMERSVGDE